MDDINKLVIEPVEKEMAKDTVVQYYDDLGYPYSYEIKKGEKVLVYNKIKTDRERLVVRYPNIWVLVPEIIIIDGHLVK